eukprot:4829791-Pyramimonas_sp.AAC.1
MAPRRPTRAPRRPMMPIMRPRRPPGRPQEGTQGATGTQVVRFCLSGPPLVKRHGGMRSAFASRRGAGVTMYPNIVRIRKFLRRSRSLLGAFWVPLGGLLG